MAQFYKILKADPLGEPWSAHGNQLQTYWCQFEGVQNAVSISKKVGNVPSIGSHVYGDLVYAESQKGNQYWKFKSSQVPEGVQRPADTPAQAAAQEATGGANASQVVPDWFRPLAAQVADIQKKVDYLYKDMKGINEPAQLEVPFEEPKKTEHVGGEPVSPEMSAKLDEIFGQEPPHDLPDDTGAKG